MKSADIRLFSTVVTQYFLLHSSSPNYAGEKWTGSGAKSSDILTMLGRNVQLAVPRAVTVNISSKAVKGPWPVPFIYHFAHCQWTGAIIHYIHCHWTGAIHSSFRTLSLDWCNIIIHYVHYHWTGVMFPSVRTLSFDWCKFCISLHTVIQLMQFICRLKLSLSCCIFLH